MAEILILLVIVLVSLLITRIAAVALTLTGMSPDVAKFQARSALSSTGLGTSEAEQIVGHPARRQIYLTLMLVGNAGLITTIATLSSSFSRASGGGGIARNFAIGIAGLLFLVILARNDRIATQIARLAERLLRRYTDLDVGDYAGLLHVGMNYGVNRIKIGEEHWLAGQTLAETRLTDEGMLVLGVERRDGDYLGAPRGDMTIERGDRVLVYGPTAPLAELHLRQAGDDGDRAHKLNVSTSQTREAEERSRDTSRRRRFRGRGSKD